MIVRKGVRIGAGAAIVAGFFHLSICCTEANAQNPTRYLYSINDEDPNQLTRVNINATVPVEEVVADRITYAGNIPFGGKEAGDRITETEGAACDPRDGTVYIVSNDRSTSFLLTLEISGPNAGLATGVGFTTVKDINSLAFLPFWNLGEAFFGLYGVSSREKRLYKIDHLTGLATPYPEPITGRDVDLEGLVFTFGAGGWPPALIAIDESDGELYEIDFRGSGKGTLLGAVHDESGLPLRGLEGLEYAPGFIVGDQNGGLPGRYLFASTTRETATTHIFLVNLSTLTATSFANDLVIDGEALVLKDELIPVELLHFRASPESAGIRLNWATASETENLGFYVYRSNHPAGSYSRMNKEMISGAGNSATRNEYVWRDPNVEAGQTYYYKLADVDYRGNMSFHGPIFAKVAAGPRTVELAQNYPNPFNPFTKIQFTLLEDAQVSLVIYNISGQAVRTLIAGRLASGSYSRVWDGRGDNDMPLPSGVYLCILEAGGLKKKMKMVLAR